MRIWGFVGVRRKSGEVWISVKDKVFAVRSVRRIPKEERWSEDCVGWVNRVPWNRYNGEEGADGDVPEIVVPEQATTGGGEKIVFVDTRQKVPRDFWIKKEDIEKHGQTRGCPGCTTFVGLGKQPHIQICKDRFKGLLSGEARVVNAENRKRDFEEKQLEKRRRKGEKKEEERRVRKEKRKAEDDEPEDKKHVRFEEGRSSSSGAAEMESSSGAAKMDTESGKRKAEDYPEGEEARIEGVEVE